MEVVRFFEQYAGVIAFQSTRLGGMSKGQFAFANLSLKNGDNYALHNRFELSRKLGVELERFVFSQQTHGKNVYVATEKDKGRGAFDYMSAVPDNDAFLTSEQGIMLTVTVADCVPIRVYDSKNRVIGAVHSGWRGTVKKILTVTLDKMYKLYGTCGRNVHLVIGASIGSCCYEVGEEVAEQVVMAYGADAGGLLTRKKKYHLDLWKANYLQAAKWGIPGDNIVVTGQCTSCMNNLFYSARRGDKGRQIAGIMLVP